MTLLPLPVPSAWGRGWGQYEHTCPDCGYPFQIVAPVGITSDLTCPACGYTEEITWPSLPDEPPNDGAWITGSLSGDPL